MKECKYKKQVEAWAQRRKEIVWMREEGWTFKDIGDELGITRQRAKQLYDFESKKQEID